MMGEEDLITLFHRASKMMARMHHRHDTPHHGQAHVVSILREQGPMNQKALMGLLNIRSSSLSEILKKLEHRGLIVRERNEQDKRGFIVSARPGGAHDGRKAKHHSKMNEIFDVLDLDEKVQLETLLGKLIRHMEATDGHCPGHHHKKKKKGGCRKGG